MNNYSIEANNLTFRFGVKKALDRVTLFVEKGAFFGLIGPDGAGKTTFIRCLTSLFSPSEGSVSVLGMDTVKKRSELIRKIGYLSQKFSLYTDLTVEENINFFARIHQVKHFREKRDELLELVDLARFRKRLAGNLSGGMKQKLALSCTLIHTPEIIFLDEPTNGVDPVARRDFFDILTSVSKSGITIFMSTPYIDEAERCDKVAFLYDGRLILNGAPDELKKNYKYKLLSVECGADNSKSAKEKLKLFDFIYKVELFGDKLHLLIKPEFDLESLKEELAKTGFSVTEIAPSLEDLFIYLIENIEGVERDC